MPLKSIISNIATKATSLFLVLTNTSTNTKRFNRQQSKTIRISNIIHLMIAIVLIATGIYFYLIGAKELTYLDLIWAIINLTCLLLNRLKKHETSKGLFLISLHAYTLAAAFIINSKELGICVLVVSSAASLFIYKLTDYLKIILFYILSIFNYLIIKYSPERYDFGIHYPQNVIQSIEIAGFAFCCFSLIAIIFAEKYINAKNEIYLLNEIRKRRKVEKALAESKRTSDKSNLAKTDFLSTIGYHIRTPLNAILGLSNLLLLESPKKNQIPKLDILKGSTDSLIRLIDNLLDFNKIESGDINIYSNEFQIRDLIENIYKSYIIKAQEKGNKLLIEIDKDIPKTLIGDEIKTSQIISNLISNALKFTENGVVDLDIRLKSKSNEHASIYFSITDTGIGIAKEKLKYIFENFATNLSGNGRNYTTSGSGLGLSISKRLAEVLGSDIYVESNLGKGTKFYFTLNFKIFEESKTLETTTKIRNLNEVRILLVDDNQMNLLVADTFLKRWNAQVDTAEDGITAVEMARDTNYDIILMDLQLPQISGFEATRQIRTFNEDVAILALTAENYGFANENFNLLGINDVLLKPFYPDDLYTKIEGLLNKESKT